MKGKFRDNDKAKRIGKRIRSKFETSDFASQAALARKADLSDITVRHAFNGMRVPTRKTLNSLADALGCSLEEIETD